MLYSDNEVEQRHGFTVEDVIHRLDINKQYLWIRENRHVGDLFVYSGIGGAERRTSKTIKDYAENFLDALQKKKSHWLSEESRERILKYKNTYAEWKDTYCPVVVPYMSNYNIGGIEWDRRSLVIDGGNHRAIAMYLYWMEKGEPNKAVVAPFIFEYK